MRSKKAMYNLLAAMTLQITTLIIGIILPRVMLNTFGSEVNGLVSSIKQFINYLTLVEAGLAGASVYSLYKPLAESDYNKVNEILTSTKKFFNKSGIIFSILALVLSLIFPYIAKSDSVSSIKVMMLVLILGINGSLEFFSMGKYRALLTADQKSYIISIIQTIGIIVNCIIIIILSYNGIDIVIVQLIATSSYIIRSILLSKYVKSKYKFIDFNKEYTELQLHQRKDVLLHQIGGMVVFNSPIGLITMFCSLVEVSIYSIYNMIFSGISGIIGIFNNGLMAGIGQIISKGNIDALQRVYREYECFYYMIVTWIYSSTYILIIPFVHVYTSGIYDANYIRLDIAILFVITGILNTLRIPQSTIVGAAGHYKETRYKALLEVVINLATSIILVKCIGMIGVLIGGICSYAYRTVDFIIYVPKNITKLPVKETLVRIIRMIILSLIIIIPFNTFINIKINNIIDWIIWAIIVSIWSASIVLIGNYINEKSTIYNIKNRIIMIIGLRKVKNK